MYGHRAIAIRRVWPYMHACTISTGRAKLVYVPKTQVHVYMSADIYCNLPFFFLIYLKKNNKKIQKNKKTVKISNLMRNRTHDHWNSSDVRVHVYHTCTRATYQRQSKKAKRNGIHRGKPAKNTFIVETVSLEFTGNPPSFCTQGHQSENLQIN